MREYLKARPELTAFIHDPLKPGYKERLLGSILNETNLRRVLTIMLDEKEFLSPFGIRAISRIHQDHPYIYRVGDQEHRVSYLPGESDNGMFGGNSNWRGPIWMPVNMLILRALLQYYLYYGNSFTIECPTGSGKQMNLYEVAEEIGRRLSSIFLKDEKGKRPVHGDVTKIPGRSPSGKIIPCSMSTSMGTPARGSARATRRDGPGRSRSSCICLRLRMRIRYSSKAKKNRWAAPLKQGGRDDVRSTCIAPSIQHGGREAPRNAVVPSGAPSLISRQPRMHRGAPDDAGKAHGSFVHACRGRHRYRLTRIGAFDAEPDPQGCRPLQIFWKRIVTR